MCRIASYINNLHPITHKPLYNIIEKIIALTIPLWNQTLTRLKMPCFRYNRIEYTECTYDPDLEDIPEDQQPQQLPHEEEDEFWERKKEWRRTKVVRPEPSEFQPPTVPPFVRR